MLASLEKSTGIEVVVVVVEQIEDEDCFNFAFNIFQKNKVGKKSTDNGLVITLSVKDRCVQFITGYGLEGDLPDALCYRIQQQQMNPYFKNEQWSEGMLNGVEKVCAVLDGTMEAEAYDDDFSDLPPIIIMFIIILVVSYLIQRHEKKCPNCNAHKLVLESSKRIKETSLYGKKIVTYRCENCGHLVQKTIKEYYGSSTGGGHYGGFGGGYHGGGGFRGGSFGGGRTGGGGAGSRF